jgi:hypothetical protein
MMKNPVAHHMLLDNGTTRQRQAGEAEIQ